jgi:ribosomal-protein-alanine N-acetyltransferase
MIDTIHTPRMLLSRVAASDLDDYARFYADTRVTATLGGVRSREWVADYIERAMAHWDQHRFGLWTARHRETGAFVGRGGLRVADIDGKREIEVAYGLMSEFWGQGFATEMAEASVDAAFTSLGLPDVVSFTLHTNLASRRVMEKVGFHYERDIDYAELPHALLRLTGEDWRSRKLSQR